MCVDGAMDRQYDVCLDKGTFDAISLCRHNADTKKKKYSENVMSVLKVNGLFIVTSCNWTLDELRQQFQEGTIIILIIIIIIIIIILLLIIIVIVMIVFNATDDNTC
jgi:type III secretory pathway component EscR